MLAIPLSDTQTARQQALLQIRTLAEFLETNHRALAADPAWQTYRSLAEQATVDLYPPQPREHVRRT
jgi:hypothetical protein